jgi:hypothetical protein
MVDGCQAVLRKERGAVFFRNRLNDRPRAFTKPLAPAAPRLSAEGSPAADLATHKLTVCYELAADFADPYRGYGSGGAEEGAQLADSSKRKTIGASTFKPNGQHTQKKRKRIP